jgi:AcrR family transcriptional regulator
MPGKKTGFSAEIQQIVDHLDERDKAIIEVGVAEFARNGFHNANMDRIADDAGVGKGTLYRRFKSKQHLFFSIFKKGFDDFIRVVNSIDPDLSVQDQVSEYCDIFVRIFRDRTGLVKLFIHEQSKILEGIDEDLIPFTRQTNDALTDFWVRMAYKWQSDNTDAEKKNPDLLGQMLSFIFRAVYILPVSIHEAGEISEESIITAKQYFMDVLFRGAFTNIATQ